MSAFIPLSELAQGLTVAQCKQCVYNLMGRVGVNTTTWKPGAVVRTIVAAVAVILSPLSMLIANLCNLGFLGLSSGSWKTAVALYVYNVDRNPATFASNPVTLTNAGGGVYSFAAGKVTVKNSTTGKQYVNTEPLSLSGAGSQSLNFKALEAGSASNSGPGAIDTIVSPRMLKVTCSNAGSLVASDAESDTALEVRCKEKLATLSNNGPFGAYSYYAKAATRLDGSPIGVTRTRVVAGPGDASCHIYVATDSGNVPGNVNDTSTDLGALSYYLYTHVVPPGGTIAIISTVNIAINVVYQVWIYSSVGKSSRDCQADILLALQESFATRTIGGDRLPSAPDVGWVFVDDIRGTIKTVFPDDTFHTVISNLAADVSCPVNGVPVLGDVTAQVNIVVRT